MIAGQEWIVTNRNGSYASSTESLANTRTYHGILVSRTGKNYERTVLLNKLFESFSVSGEEITLDTNYYPDTVFPNGYRYIVSFSGFPVPTYVFKIGDTIISKKIAMHPYADLVSIRYEFSGVKPDIARLFPLVSFRSFHSTLNCRECQPEVIQDYDSVIFRKDSMSLFIGGISSFRMLPDWYYNFQYPEDRSRGTNYTEDLYNPGYFTIEEPSKAFEVNVSFGKGYRISFQETRSAMEEFIRSQGTYLGSLGNTPLKSSLLITRDNIMAGYHWFGPWARDAFISMPGILLTTGKFDLSQNLLAAYRQASTGGMVPKRLENPEDFATADSGLLYIYAAWKFMQYSGRGDFASRLLPFMLEIIQSYIRGNEYFRLDGPFVRTLDAPLTWMDAAGEGMAYTPRMGLPVEINAMWYNALMSVADIAKKTGNHVTPGLEDLALSVKEKFPETFVRNTRILDVAKPDDSSLRPNFILAFSLPFPVMEGFRGFKEIVDEKLVTPYGLRTLDPSDPHYISRYEGGFQERDRAYHNGTVWPWLMGPYLTASARAGFSAPELFKIFRPLLALPYIPEIFDGTGDGVPRGCIIQAWSYGELMRSYHENVINPGGMFS